MAKIYTQIINACWECPWSTESGDLCTKSSRYMLDIGIVQEWCPLPNIEDNFICEMSVEECYECGVECAEKEIKLLLK